MFDWENKIQFYKKEDNLRITYHCGKCNNTLNITELVNYLCDYGWEDCPSGFYQAWKVLRLGTSEYADNKAQPELEHSCLTWAVNLLDLESSKNEITQST